MPEKAYGGSLDTYLEGVVHADSPAAEIAATEKITGSGNLEKPLREHVIMPMAGLEKPEYTSIDIPGADFASLHR